MGHAFITRSSFHQPLAPLLSLPTAEPSVPEVSVTGDNMSPRWGAGGKPHAHRSSNDYLIRLFTLDLKEERGTKWRLLPICSTQGKESGERAEGRNGRSVNTADEGEGPEEWSGKEEKKKEVKTGGGEKRLDTKGPREEKRRRDLSTNNEESRWLTTRLFIHSVVCSKTNTEHNRIKKPFVSEQENKL